MIRTSVDSVAKEHVGMSIAQSDTVTAIILSVLLICCILNLAVELIEAESFSQGNMFEVGQNQPWWRPHASSESVHFLIPPNRNAIDKLKTSLSGRRAFGEHLRQIEKFPRPLRF